MSELNKCECCERSEPEVTIVGVASSGIGPISFLWCAECLKHGAEPKWAAEAMGIDEQIVFYNGSYVQLASTYDQK